MKLSNFQKNDTVLLLGEGNFSFAVSLVKHNLPIAITATCLESSIVNDNTRRNVDYLQNHGTRVLLGVDATKLEHLSSLRSQNFHKIIFNFPHVGGKMRLEKNRALLKDFFISVQNFLNSDGFVFVNLCNGQGGTLADEPQRRWDDTWKVKEMAAHGNFILTRVEPFETTNFLDYLSTGYRSLEKEFNTQNSLTHCFEKVPPPSLEDFSPKIKLRSIPTMYRDNRIRWIDVASRNYENIYKLAPPVFKFDITLGVGEDFEEFNFYAVLYNFFGNIVRNVEFIGAYQFPDDKITRTYRIYYQSDDIPLYRQRMVDIHCNTVADTLEDNLKITVTR